MAWFAESGEVERCHPGDQLPVEFLRNGATVTWVRRPVYVDYGSLYPMDASAGHG